jgi:hypothetical protein
VKQEAKLLRYRDLGINDFTLAPGFVADDTQGTLIDQSTQNESANARSCVPTVLHQPRISNFYVFL